MALKISNSQTRIPHPRALNPPTLFDGGTLLLDLKFNKLLQAADLHNPVDTNHPRLDSDAALGWLGDTAQDLKQRAFPRSIPANDADDIALLHLASGSSLQPLRTPISIRVWTCRPLLTMQGALRFI
jgi:hypothetical protein